MLTNAESRAIDWATRNHKLGHRKSLQSARSRAGATKSRNCFTSTSPSYTHSPSCDTIVPSSGRFVVVVGSKRFGRVRKRTIQSFASKTQAESYALSIGGWVEG